MNRKLIYAIFVIIALVGIYFFIQRNQSSPLKANDNAKLSPTSSVAISKEIKQQTFEIDPYEYERRKKLSVEDPALDVSGDPYWVGLKEESRVKYGDFVNMYWPDYLVGAVDEFDVDGDGKKEQIAFMLPPGVNGKGGRVDILKNGKILFTSSEYYVRIEPNETNNGFYLYWQTGEQFERGSVETKTKFIYENNKFIPTAEEEVAKG